MKQSNFKRLLSGLLVVALLLTVVPAGVLAAPAADAPAPLLYYNFQEFNSTIVNDASGNGKAGVMKNQDKGGYSVVDTEIYGTAVKALSLPGGEDGGYLEFPLDILDGERNALTISLWVNLPTNNGYQRIWDFGTGTTSYIYLLSDGYNDGAEGYCTAITTSGWSNEQTAHTETNFARNKWVLSTVVINDKTLSLYLDGKLIDTKETTISLKDLGKTTNNWLGYGQFGDDPTKGMFAEVTIYDGALTSDQVAALFNKTAANCVAADVYALSVPTEAIEDFTLTTAGTYGSTITWTSNNAAIAVNGRNAVVTRPTVSEKDAVVTLTATVVNGEDSATKAFQVTVPAQRSDIGIAEYDAEHLDLGDLSGLVARITLPATGSLGSTITWTSSNPAVFREDGRVFRPAAGEENGKAVLTATVTYGEATVTRNFDVTVLAKPESKVIKSVEPINVTTAVGVAPTLPNYVKVTYTDGSTAKVRAVWPSYLTKSDYAKVGSFVVTGATLDAGYGLVANVTVVEEVKEDIVLEAMPFDLSDISLDGDSILTQNRDRDVAYLKLLDNDRMLYNFRKTFGVDTKGASALGGWDEPTGLLRGHSTGHYMSALALAYASTGDAELKTKLDYMIHEMRTLQLMSDGDAAAFKHGGTAQSSWSTNPKEWGKGFISAYSPDQFSLLEIYTPYATIWAPYYTLHKLLSGFLDAYTYTGNEEALDIAKDLGKWVYNRLSACTQAQLTKMWDMYIAGEFGGMNECLAYLYRLTGDMDYLNAAKLFDNTKFFDNLAANYDDIAGRHANQHLPQIIGALELYQATVEAGNEEIYYYDVAKNFWDMVTSRYAYSIGGVGTGERFQQPYKQATNINAAENCETCCAYNLLKLTRDLYQYDPENAEYMDYYERTLYNQILASQTPSVTNSRHNGTTYMLPIGPGQRRSYGGDYNSFTCCHGTGMENHVKYQEAAYYYAGNTMYVGLYIPSSVVWADKGVKVTQENEFPSDTSKFTVSALDGAETSEFTMKLRVPYWTDAFKVTVNGKAVITSAEASSYVGITVKAGDVIVVETPYTLHLDATPDKRDGSTVASVMYGPWVMVANNSSTEWITLALSSNLEQSITPVKDAAMPTVTVNNMTLKPMYDAYNYAYHAYFKVLQSDDDTTYYTMKITNTTTSYGSFVLSAESIAEESDLIITAYPKAGYVVKSLTADGAVVEATENPNVFIVRNIQSNLELSGSFRQEHPAIPNPSELDQYALPAAHYTSSWETINGINNKNFNPTKSAFGTGRGWGNWSQPTGSVAWVTYTWEVPVTLNTNEIYWYDDNDGTRVPTKLVIEYLDENGQWQTANIKSTNYFQTDKYNTIEIDTITTTCVRLNMTIQSSACGIGRWKVSYVQPADEMLARAISLAESLDDNYTDATLAKMLTALEAAKAVAADATDDVKVAAAQNLDAAIAALVYEKREPVALPELAIVSQPVDFVGNVGEVAVFSVKVNREDVTYQWKFTNNGGKSWTDSTLPGADSATLPVELKAFRAGQMYQCVITDSEEEVVETVVVTMDIATSDLTITTHPADATVAVKENATFTVVAEGEGLTYQWMYSNNGGKTFMPSTLDGYNTATITVAGKAFRSGQMYKCVVTDASNVSVESNVATLTVG